MSLLIQGAKAGDKPRTPTIAPDDHASISKVKILYALSEGEVKGLVDGAASILLDGTSLVDANGNANFDSVEWEIRHGTVDQTHIAGLPNLSSEIGINTPLRSGTPWVRSVVNTQLSSVNVNLSWSRLSHARDNGDVTGTAVHYAIDVQTDGGGYTTIIDKTIRAKTSGRYQRTHNVPLPDAQQGWQIRVRKITPDGDNTRLFNDMRVDSIAEIIDAKLRYPHTALLYLSFDARTFSSMPKIAVEMYGRYLKVPSNYDAATRTSTGIWDGTFKTAYTNNPAWVYYDLITNDRYGLGDRLKPFMINKWAIAHIARICDEPVDDGKGGTEPRFTCNLYLQKSEQAYQVLQHIAAIFRGMSFWNGSQIVLDADTPRDADYVITRANVVDGAFNKSGTAIDDRHTLVQVAWSNPANNYETDYVTVRNERAIAKYGINPLEMPIVGCTSEGQAYRAGLAALLSEQIRTQTVNFAMGLDGSLPSVGSRVDIADMMFTGANNGGRISAVNADRTVITVDRDDVPATTDDRLTVNLESGRAQTREILSVLGRNITVKAPFDPVAAENVWAVDSDELPTMPFIVLSITENDDRTQYTYSALQYDAGLYPQIDNGTIIEPRPPVPPFNPYIIAAPDDVTIESRHQVNQGITVTTLIIVWDQVKDAVAYDVEWRKDDGDWIKLPRTGNISIEVDGVYSGNYLARVRAVSAFDAVSKPTTSTLTAIVGKAGTPPQLASLTATGLLFGMQIDWAFSAGSGDTAYTEIQVGSAPDVNVTTLGQFAYNTDTHTVTGLQGNLAQSYRGRIVDKLGNVSPWTPWVTGTTDANADKVLDLVQGQINESSLNSALTSKIEKIEVVERELGEETATRIQDIIDTKKQADDAQRAADNAAQAASDAATLAGNKGEVIYQWQTPSSARQLPQNLWIDTNGGKNTPKRWNGSAWVVVTDKAATDAAQAASAAQAAADAADAKAVAAQSTADTAKANAKTADDKAAAAQQSANAALSSLADIAADSKLTAVEKQQVKLIFDDIQRAHTDLLARATKYDVVATDYKAAYNALVSYITPKLADMSTTSIIVRTAFNSKFDDLFLKRAELNTAIVNAAKLVADTAQNTANDALSKANAANDNIVTILDEQIEINNELGLQYETLQGVILDYKPRYASKDRYASKTRGQNWAYWKTVARDNYVTNERITNLQSDFNDTNATVRQELETLATNDAAFASSFNQLKAQTGDNSALIQELDIAITTPDTGLAAQVDELQSAVGDNLASLVEGSGAFNDEFESISGNFSTMQGIVDGQQTAIETVSAVGNVDKLKNEIAKARLDKDAIKLQAQSDSLTSAISDYDTKIDEIIAKREATTNADLKAEYAKQIADLNDAKADAVIQKGDIADQVAQLADEQKVLDDFEETQTDILAQHTVKMNTKGFATGFGLMLDKSGFSEFGIDVDSFYVGAPDGSKSKTFVHYSTPQTINGVVVPIGTYINAAYIAKASIDLAQINTASITSLSALSATIGHFKSAESGARLEIKDSLLSVYDDNDVLRVRLGLW